MAISAVYGDLCRIVRAGPWKQEPELVPAHTGDQAVAPDIGEEKPAHDAQDLVADVVPMDVVDPLEVIDFSHHQVRGCRPARGGRRDLQSPSSLLWSR
jgi:hypothetical protein